MKIGINIGHYGTQGAVGYLGEVKCNEEVSGHLTELLKGSGHEVLECNDATYPDYVSATKLANKYELDLVISLHCNSSKSPASNGTEVLYFKGNQKTRSIAAAISSAVSASLGTQNRGAKERDDIYILSHTKAPAVLVESFFVSNQNDSAKYNPQKIAAAVAECIPCDNGGQRGKYSYDKTVDNMICDGVTDTENMGYWESVLRGQTQPSPEFIRTILDRYHRKVGM